MIARVTAQILAEVADVGLPERLGPALSRVDPLLRAAVRKRANAAIAAAKKQAPHADDDTQLALAFLIAERRLGGTVGDQNAIETPAGPSGIDDCRTAPGAFDVADGTAVEARFRTRAAPYLKLSPPNKRLSFGLVALLLVGGGAATFALTRTKPTPEEQFLSSPLGKALDQPFVAIVIDDKAENGRKAFADKGVAKQVAPMNTALFEDFFAEIPRASVAPGSLDTALEPLFTKLNALNEGLRAAQVPALIHAYAGPTKQGRTVWATAYYVPVRATYKLGDKDLPFVLGRRIDNVNLKEARFVKLNAERWGVVSLVIAEDEVATGLVQPLGSNEGLSVFGRAIAPFLKEFVLPEIERSTKLTAKDLEVVENIRRSELALNGEIARIYTEFNPPTGYRFSALRRRTLQESAKNAGGAAKSLRGMLEYDDAFGPYRPKLDFLVFAHAEDTARFSAAIQLEYARLGQDAGDANLEQKATVAAAYRMIFEAAPQGRFLHETLWSLLFETYQFSSRRTIALRQALGSLVGDGPLPIDPNSPAAALAMRALFTQMGSGPSERSEGDGRAEIQRSDFAKKAEKAYEALAGSPPLPMTVVFEGHDPR